MKKTYPDSRIIAPTAGQGWIWRLKPMYESPIFVRQKTESIVRKYREKIDDYIYESVVKVGVDVDKEELIRALRYDRDQYEKGYHDGVIDSRKHGKWMLAEDGWYCSACELYPPFDCDPEEKGIPFCPHCGARMDG